MTLKQKLFTTLLLCVLYFPFQIKAQSCCEEDDEITMCYLSSSDFCEPSLSLTCSAYSLDGAFMENSLLLKLQSPQNYGPNGTVDCNLVLKKLDYLENIEMITDCGCDMIFVPVISVEPGTGVIDIDTTFIPIDVLSIINDWSLECKNNLVIIFQAEAEYWGYTMENANQNPNTQIVNPFSNSIFNGPFGSINSINQAGSYQGVFTELPDTGVELLAQDNNNNATIALDLFTNDIVVGDIGIFCSGNAGGATEGSGINNANDVFICNIFALGCQIAKSKETEYSLLEICPTETVLLPNGQSVSDYGIYIDTLQDINDCDSIIFTTEIVEKVIEPVDINYDGCEGDGFSLTVNDVIYNEQNPIGQEAFTTSRGCDTIVNVDLFYSRFYSISRIDSTGTVTNCNSSPFDNIIPNDYNISWTPSEFLSCSDCPNPFVIAGCNTDFKLSVDDGRECIWDFDIKVDYAYNIYIPNVFSPNGDGNNDFFSAGMSPYCENDGNFEINIFNRWGGNVFSSSDLFFRWDGSFKNKNLPPGIYTYWFTYNCNFYRGDVAIVR